jgi:16S rRNA G966 N2-methylase RsmD
MEESFSKVTSKRSKSNTLRSQSFNRRNGILPQDFKKLKINEEGKYSITRPYEAKQITKIISNQLLLKLRKHSRDCIITDATAGVGGDTISFSGTFKWVNSIEISSKNFKLLKTNCNQMELRNITLYNDDCLPILPTLNQDVIYIDPPWGGVGYKENHNLQLFLSNFTINELIGLLSNKFKDVLIFLKLPLNANLNDINIENRFTILNKKESPSFYLIQIQLNNEC